MSKPLNGQDYVARVRLSDAADRTLAVPGETCARVPAASLVWLLEQDLIEPAPLVTEAAPEPLSVDEQEPE